VDNRHQLEHLRRLGCHIAQGFLFSRPVPAEQLSLLLDRNWAEEFSPA
jgi:EAL domain-containing protein (putative c-di-GMP-specific phosphodiesterase class I)